MAATRLLLSEGTAVTVIDCNETPALFEIAHSLELDGARVCLGAVDLPRGFYDLCVVSPGVAVTSPWMREAADRGIPVVSELELGWSRCRGRTLAITGSNGKSTAVKWCAEAAEHAGIEARVAGNYGPAVCDVARRTPLADLWVLEVSSFQLETVGEFRPDVGVLLNILPNHLNRHETMDAYLATKARMFSRTNPGDTCVVPADLADQIQSSSGGHGLWVTFDSKGADYCYDGNEICHEGTAIASMAGTMFDNGIMGPTAAAVLAALSACGIDPSHAVEAAKTMDPLPHRMQPVGDLRGVKFVNDSKATNLAAMEAALQMAQGPVRLIAGGLAKEKDFERAKEVLAKRAVTVYLIGTASDEMASAWSRVVPAVQCESLEEAVRQAWNDAQAGETLLLSPGCASFDQFSSFEDRGRCFLGIVKSLAEEEGI